MTTEQEELKTSDEWNDEYGKPVFDPDGWDRMNFEESWFKPITLAEFRERAMHSTVRLNAISEEGKSLFT